MRIWPIWALPVIHTFWSACANILEITYAFHYKTAKADSLYAYYLDDVSADRTREFPAIWTNDAGQDYE